MAHDGSTPDTGTDTPTTGKRKAGARKPPGFSGDPLWYKDAVVYQLHVKSFFDANDDGIGDFAGLIQKLDYIAGLGVNTIWLLPFYPSPRRDDGYDVSDYRGVHPDYGPMADAKEFIAEAHKRGLRVITELIINHTSDQHPWFQRARKAKPGSAARDFYVWSEDDKRYAETRIIFVDTEQSNWTWDPVAKAYYWHRFYSHQPDLNFDNPQVIRAVLGAMRFWLALGVDGLRLDAVPYLFEREGTNNENLAETHAVLKLIRAEIDATYPGRMLLAEANQWPEDVQHYFGGKPQEKAAGGATEIVGDECHMAFHFPLMPRMYMAIAQEDRFPITDILRQTPDIPADCQWAIFLRNHDELTLEMVTDNERDYLWRTYASDRRARLNVGIRRRLAPLVERDRHRLELLNSLLLSMPGTPVIYYGDEIGMGDNIYLGDRDGVRTPMQWSSDRNGGFSRADPARLVLPPIMDPLYGFQANNVEAQANDPHSLLNWMRRMLTIRKRCKAFGRGSIKLMYPSNRRILAYLRKFDSPDDPSASQLILCVANMSRAAQAVELDLAQFAGQVPVEMLGGAAFPPIGQLPYLLTLPPHGFYWFLIAETTRMPDWHAAPPEPLPEYITLVLSNGIREMLDDTTRRRLETDVLPVYLPRRRWFAAKGGGASKVRIVRETPLPHATRQMLMLELDVETGGTRERYLLPIGLLPESSVITALPQQLALARVRRSRSVSLLTDAVTIDAFAHTLLALMRSDTRLPAGDGELRFVPTARLQQLAIAEDAEVRRLTVEQSNTSLVVGDLAIIKLFRKLTEGVHPEAEMGRALTERGYPNIAPLLGEVVRIEPDGRQFVLGVAQGFIHSQGDAWAWVQRALQRAVRDKTLPESGPTVSSDDTLHQLTSFATLLGKRLGELHVALATPSETAPLATEVVDVAVCARIASHVAARFDGACAKVDELAKAKTLAGDAATLAKELLSQRAAVLKKIAMLAKRAVGSLQIRIHGDLHLGQVLVSQGDAYFVDFEGEPTRPLEERRSPSSPLRDVAGVLRSFEYAAECSARVPLSVADNSAAKVREDLHAQFRSVCAGNFLSTYRAASGALPHQWRDAKDEAAVLDLFLIERAAHEVDYEVANRPDWLVVPLRGLVNIAARVRGL
ncbi:MAG: maltose alpha-D-glucosyltransferase [Panacagrimonas sp.]